MMKLDRRSFLKLLAVTPLCLKSLGQDIVHVEDGLSLSYEANYSRDYYDYIIATGRINLPLRVFRDGEEINVAEYKFFDGRQIDPNPGKVFIRFDREQRSFTGEMYEINL